MLMVCLLLLNDVGLCVSFDRADTVVARSRSLEALSLRGGPLIAEFLTRKHEDFLAKQRQNDKQGADIELLTALRRAQCKSEPLPVVLNEKAELESIFPDLPGIRAALINRDSEKLPIKFQEGGDYRSGRQARWRFDVRDARGKTMPVRERWGNGTGGGIFLTGVLKHGESWATTLSMRTFIELPPGDYTVVVEYHDWATIADLRDATGMIKCRSEPFKLHIKKRTIDVARADCLAAREAIAALSEKGPVQILTGLYDEAVHDFIRPDSATGKLLALGWRAVPALLDALEEKDVKLQKRAWLFAILFSITGCNDPREEVGVLAGYDSREGAWAVSGGRDESGGVTGLGFGSSSSSRGGKYDADAQKTFAKNWLAFRDWIVVREKP